MSSYVLKKESIAVIAMFLHVQLNTGFNFTGIESDTRLAFNFRDCVRAGTYCESLIYEKLYRMNVEAVNLRYPDNAMDVTVPDMPNVNIRFKPPVILHNERMPQKYHYEVSYALDTYLYQIDCIEGLNAELYFALEYLSNALHYMIARSTHGYLAAGRREYNCSIIEATYISVAVTTDNVNLSRILAKLIHEVGNYTNESAFKLFDIWNQAAGEIELFDYEKKEFAFLFYMDDVELLNLEHGFDMDYIVENSNIAHDGIYKSVCVLSAVQIDNGYVVELRKVE